MNSEPTDSGLRAVRVEGPGTGSPTNGRLRILVVEDDSDTARSYQLLLNLWGHQTASWPTGKGALEAARAYRPDIVLLDIGLPGVDGFHLARLFREQVELRDVPLVGVTGFADPAHRLRSLEVGLDYYLVKPVDPKVLQTLLRALGEQRKNQSPSS